MPCQVSPTVSTPSELAQFRRDLLAWFSIHQRDLPWRRTRDPYSIWVSEIMLQQTRVSAVIPYYERFLARFPDFQALAAASEHDLLAHWAGLGYYYRARNMQKAGQLMCESGGFPSTHAGILGLPGIGDYTAAAVLSIAFDLPYAVLDGNVMRVVSRLFADSTDIASSLGKKHFSKLASELLDRENPGAFNQAMMELGATVCAPKNPQCLLCPASGVCRARALGTQDALPVKTAKMKSVIEERSVFWIQEHGNVLVWQRPPDSRLMPGFWELPEAAQLPHAVPEKKLGSFRHTITFHYYRFGVWSARAPSELGTCRWMALPDLRKMPMSTVLKKAAKLIYEDSSAC
jgi:A/G-specific adenine glycosylase